MDLILTFRQHGNSTTLNDMKSQLLNGDHDSLISAVTAYEKWAGKMRPIRELADYFASGRRLGWRSYWTNGLNTVSDLEAKNLSIRNAFRSGAGNVLVALSAPVPAIANLARKKLRWALSTITEACGAP